MAHVRQKSTFRNVGSFGCFFRLLKIVFDPFAIRDVLDNSLELERASIWIEQPPDSMLLPENFAFTILDAIIKGRGRFFFWQGIEVTQRDLIILAGPQAGQEVGAEQFLARLSIKTAEGAIN